jgi:hypothetical protein
MRQNSIKYGRDDKIESKKSFEFLLPNLVNGLNKSWLKFCPFCIEEREQKEING